jgi:DNA-binding NarL/FixJ family response regulator
MKILIADGCAFVREGIKSILCAEKDMGIAGEAENGEKAGKLAKEIKPDVILLDLALPKISGFVLARRLRGRCKIILIAGEEDLAGAAVSRLGAAGCMPKNMPASSLAAAIRKIADAEAESPANAKIQAASPDTGGEKKIRLTTREMEILQLIGRGMNNRDIAGALYLSEKTVKNHLTNMFKKLKVHDRTQALLYALKSKIVLL